MSKKVVALHKYSVTVKQQPDGTFLAVCPAVQGVYAEGKTYLDAVLNVEDVLRLCWNSKAPNSQLGNDSRVYR